MSKQFATQMSQHKPHFKLSLSSAITSQTYQIYFIYMYMYVQIQTYSI